MYIFLNLQDTAKQRMRIMLERWNGQNTHTNHAALKYQETCIVLTKSNNIYFNSTAM